MLTYISQAPAFLRRCTKGGLPVWTVVITGLFGLLAVSVFMRSVETITPILTS
jgi:amino acid permease